MKNASHTYEISLFTSICPKILHRLLKDRVSMLSRLWKCEELVWIPSQSTDHINDAGVMTLARRLGFAIVDETCMNCYYDSSTQVLNNGGLTLISAEYFPFGYELLRSVRQSFSDKHLKDHGNDSVKLAFESLVQKKKVRAVFDACDQGAAVSLDSSLKDIIFTELIRKVFHARINEVFTKYRDEHFGRHSKKGDGGTTFR